MDFDNPITICTIHKPIAHHQEKKKPLKCPNCGRLLGYRGSSLKVMCGDKYISSVRHHGRMIITESTEHYIPIMVCESCIKKRTYIKAIIGILFILVIPLAFWIIYGATLGIIFFVIGLAIFGGTLNSMEKLSLSVEEAEKIFEEQMNSYM